MASRKPNHKPKLTGKQALFVSEYLRACLKSPSNRHPRMLLAGVQGICKNLDSR